jgi:uncharacterized protein (TIGR03790 family)
VTRSRFLRRAFAALAAALVAAPAIARAQTADQVLLVVNQRSEPSRQIGDYYAKKRQLAPTHVVRLDAPATESIDRAAYAASIEDPIADWITKHNFQDQILYIVLTKGVPLRVSGAEGREGVVASVDSELTLLYRRLVGIRAALPGRIANPYYLGDKPVTDARPFSHLTTDIYLVTRLDGFTVEDVTKLIDRGVAPATGGRIVLDSKGAVLDRGGDQWLRETAERLRTFGAGERVLLEMTPALVTTTEPVLGYYSWGSNDPANRLRRFGLRFVPGALAGMFVSTDGRTFTEPKPEWAPGPSSQSLVGDLIRDGVTGVSAQVTEPYLDAIVRPQILFPAYLAGFNLAESYYLAMPYLSWQTVVIGDPLCAPFQSSPQPESALHKGMDLELGLPMAFAERRLDVLSTGGLKRDALRLMLQAESRGARDDTRAVEALLDRATTIEPRLTVAQFQLATLYDARGDHRLAVERYRKILAVEPQNAVALNNLAYTLAEHLQAPRDSLPLAERAYSLAPIPMVADTLGWIHHLLGDDRTALPLSERAVAGAGDNFDVQIHAATIYAALNDFVKARKALDAALALNPGAGTRDDVRKLRDKIRTPGSDWP